MIKRIICVIQCIILFSAYISAQKAEKVCGTYTYIVPENVTLEEARVTALERAKIEALADKFGTIVSQNNSTIIKNNGESSKVDFFSLGGSDVKGEWIETLQDTCDVIYKDHVLIVKASVCGKARKIVNAGVNFASKILCNGLDQKNESDEFHSGDDLYLWFKSPANGFLAVYLIDESQNAFCLLPYRRNESGKVEVKANNEYLFFSKKAVPAQEQLFVDEYTLTCDQSMERNKIYIIFSPKQFTKANDEDDRSDTLPRQLSFKDFQEWLVKNRNYDKEMSMTIKNIIIKKVISTGGGALKGCRH